ncbi:MAG TPA: hypothetical protein VFW77_03860 [Candidatus Saccharimonadales bacterium]|nr:hypothetical protein [Candidatus Saccharimonadales bacterium]
MANILSLSRKSHIGLFIAGAILLIASLSPAVFAATSSKPLGIEGKVPGGPPKNAPTITFPGNGSSFTELPVKVTGLCQSGLLVKIFKNSVFGGSAVCNGGSYTIQIDLFVGKNELIARQYDDLGQSSPDSNKVTVTFPVSQFSGLNRISLSSSFAKKGANPGETLTWPIILSGGNGPYAITVDWGDGTQPDIISQEFPGTFNISHVYKSAGVYNVLIRASDKNKETAFLQLVGVGNGEVTDRASSSAAIPTKTVTKVIWWPALLLIPLILVAFWLGRKHEIFSLRRKFDS